MQHFWSHHFTACNIQDHYVAFNLVLKSNLQSLLIKAHRCAEHNTSLSGVSPPCHLFLCPASSVELPANAWDGAFVLGATRAQRTGANSLSLLWSIYSVEPNALPPPPLPQLALAWVAGVLGCALHMALQQKEPIDERTDWCWVYLMAIPQLL